MEQKQINLADVAQAVAMGRNRGIVRTTLTYIVTENSVYIGDLMAEFLPIEDES